MVSILLGLNLLVQGTVLPASSCFIPNVTIPLSPAAQTDTAPAADLNISAPSAILMEASTGAVVYEKNSHEARHPASVTKIMTLLLIFDALSSKQISLDDTVTVSEYAASMGGSQVFLEPGETQTVETMIKCISVASANDIALMSRELITKYPKIHDYCTIWMENITHTTAKGSSEFGLTNTNKLIKHYQYATGLKTGFTNTAMYCISATAKKDDMELIAVIMGAPDIKSRSADATTLLNYGFGKCRIYCDSHEDKLDDLPVEKGLADSVGIIYQRPFQYMTTDGSDLTGITKSIELPENVTAPVKKGNTAGKAVYSLNGTPIGSVNIVYEDTVDAADYKDYFCRTLLYFVP